ncbi:MAG: hypothetical protein AUG49_20965 [Catenulispora sp. 13_1_20CM_3_70_7]|nr:MAG: hypothetical protein AUG49_20965 [Catenulispora sp. 13_1_20CM_3_70_7]
MSMTPWRRPGLGPVTTFVATWNSVAVLVLLGPRLKASAAVLVGIAAAFEALAADPDPAGIGDDGFLAGGVGAALVCGPLLAGAVAAVDGWRWVFWVDAAVGAGIGLVVLVRGARAGSDVPHHRDGAADPGHRPVRPRDRVDLLGLALVAVAVAGPVGALDEAATVGWWDIRTLGLFAAGACACSRPPPARCSGSCSTSTRCSEPARCRWGCASCPGRWPWPRRCRFRPWRTAARAVCAG